MGVETQGTRQVGPDFMLQCTYSVRVEFGRSRGQIRYPSSRTGADPFPHKDFPIWERVNLQITISKMAIRILRYAALRSIWVLCDASGVAALPGRFLPMNCGAFWRRFFLFNRRPTSNSDAGCAAAGILVL